MDELQKLTNLIKSINKGGYHRCSICNSVSNELIETEAGDYKPNLSFTNDPNDSMHFICIDCSEVIQDSLSEFEENEF